MKAFILAAGLGSRLGILTKDTPKCLMKVAGATILEHVCLKLKKAGISEVVINLHYLPEKIVSLIEEKEHFGLQISYSYEENLLGTGGAILNALSLLGDREDVLVYNSDVLCDIDLNSFFSFHNENSPYVSLAIMTRNSSRPLQFSLNKKLLSLAGWRNLKNNSSELLKPLEETIAMAFTGIQILSPKSFGHFKQFSYPFSSISAYLKIAQISSSSTGHTVLGYDIGSVKWFDVGTPERLAMANTSYS
jgi:N-acetyl-alpha-D-muramate 1-phosphate uridylyltransferase